jgi:hypothetical protein
MKIFLRQNARFCFSAESEFSALPNMIPGISSSGSYAPQPLVSKLKGSATPPAPAPGPEVRPEAEATGPSVPEGDEQSLTREFNLFDLATRQFAQILPRLELATVPIE